MAPSTHKRVHAEAAACDSRRKPGPNKKIRLDSEVQTPTTTIRQTRSNSKHESNEAPIKTTPKPSEKIERSAGNQKMTASPREHEAAQGEHEVVQGEKADVHDHQETTQSEKADVQDPPEAIQCEKTPTLNKQTPDAAEEAPTPHTPSHSQGQLVALRGQGLGQQVQSQGADEENLPQWRDSHADFSLHGDGGNLLHRLNALTLHCLFMDQN